MRLAPNISAPPTPPNFYTTPGREPPAVIGRAFCDGCGGRYIESRFIEDGPVSFYGISRHTLPIYRKAVASAWDWYYIDNGYFRPGHFDGYYRVTRNAAQHDGSGSFDAARWRALGLTLAPWRKSGRHVLLIGQSETYYTLRGMRPGSWLFDTAREIARVTDRPIILRPKPMAATPFKRSIEEDFADAWCVVTYTSNVAVQAIVAGIPAFVTAPCAALAMSAGRLDEIETPAYPERDHWAWALAANQWTVAEMRSGQCWRELCEANVYAPRWGLNSARNT